MVNLDKGIKLPDNILKLYEEKAIKILGGEITISAKENQKTPLKFKLIVKYGSGYEKWKCLKCDNTIVIPADRLDKTIWCNVCNTTVERPMYCPYCRR